MATSPAHTFIFIRPTHHSLWFVSQGLSYTIPHAASQVNGSVGGNSVYKPSAFGPVDGTTIAMSEEERRRGVERRIQDLAELGGWRAGAASDLSLPNWQRRGFDWKWRDDSGVDITHRVAGKNGLSARAPRPSLMHVPRCPHASHAQEGHRLQCLSVHEPLTSCSAGVRCQAVATRFANAKIHDTFAPPHTFKRDDGTEAVSLPPLVRLGINCKAHH